MRLPGARFVGSIAPATLVTPGAAIGRCTDKLTGDGTLLRGLHGRPRRDDIVPADRYSSSYFEFALLTAQGVEVLTRQIVGRTVDSRRGRRMGKGDPLVGWTRPRRAPWMDGEAYAAIPETVTVRASRARAGKRGSRTGVPIVVSALLDPGPFAHAGLAGLSRDPNRRDPRARATPVPEVGVPLRCRPPPGATGRRGCGRWPSGTRARAPAGSARTAPGRAAPRPP